MYFRKMHLKRVKNVEKKNAKRMMPDADHRLNRNERRPRARRGTRILFYFFTLLFFFGGGAISIPADAA